MASSADFIIIGSGIAGVRAAIELSTVGRVAVLTKSRADESNTEYAQGGIAVVLNDDDEVRLHYRDTLAAGDGLCDESAARTLVEEGPARIEELIAWGTDFDREGSKLAFTREAAHSRRRVLHARGDSTGQEINRALIQRARQSSRIQLHPHCCALELLLRSGRCVGVRYLDRASGSLREIEGSAVLLATGGLGRLYRETTNPEVATGDGFALAFRAGADLADMEFVQFHPTALALPNAPQFLLSEALRGEGALLRNAAGKRFMPRSHEAAELAPRDVVSRAIFMESERRGESSVFLDLTHLDPDFVRRRFPRIHHTCARFGLDLARDRIPVFPAAHYMMGGVYTDLDGRTTVAGLFAAGEVACTGVHGANRLASNSLLEGLVFGQRAGRTMTASASPAAQLGTVLTETSWPAASSGQRAQPPRLRSLMTERAGIVRQGPGLMDALTQLQALRAPLEDSQPGAEIRSLLENGRVICAAALLRTESRGGHYRTDYPDRDDQNWRRHLVLRRIRPGRIEWATASRLQPSRGPVEAAVQPVSGLEGEKSHGLR